MAQELNTKMMEPLVDKKLVRPYEKVKVYATGASKFHKEGRELNVHPLLAEKLIAAGKATKEPVKDKKAEKAK